MQPLMHWKPTPQLPHAMLRIPSHTHYLATAALSTDVLKCMPFVLSMTCWYIEFAGWFINTVPS